MTLPRLSSAAAEMVLRFFLLLAVEMLTQHSAGAAGQVHFNEVFTGIVGILLRFIGHMRNLTPSTIFPIVAGKSNVKIGTLLYGDSQSTLRPAGVEVKSKEQALSGESDTLFGIIHHVLVAETLAEHIHILG